MFGNMNRAKPSSHIRCVTASDVKPIASDEPNSTPAAAAKNDRRVVAFCNYFGRHRTCVVRLGRHRRNFDFLLCRGRGRRRPSAAASAFVIGPGFAPFRAAARMLAVSFGAAAHGTAIFARAGLAPAALAGRFLSRRLCRGSRLRALRAWPPLLAGQRRLGPARRPEYRPCSCPCHPEQPCRRARRLVRAMKQPRLMAIRQILTHSARQPQGQGRRQEEPQLRPCFSPPGRQPTFPRLTSFWPCHPPAKVAQIL